MNARRNQSRRASRRFASRRRGIVLLIVVSLLMLFLLVGATFVVVSSNSRHAAEVVSRRDLYTDDPQKLHEEALGILLRGSRGVSLVSGHSMFEDELGHDGVKGVINPPETKLGVTLPLFTEGNGQVITFGFRHAPHQPFGRTFYEQPDFGLGYYTGCVFTILDGPLKGRSTRVLDCMFSRGVATAANPNPQWGTDGNDDNLDGIVDDPMEGGWPGTDDIAILRIEAFDSDLTGVLGASDLIGRTFLINGRPFNGTGSGYDPSSGGVDSVITLNNPSPSLPVPLPAPLPALPVSLLPNHAMYPVGIVPYSPTSGRPIAIDVGGLDETWDAPDIQNMFLGMVCVDPFQNPPGGIPDLKTIPSFHRAELVSYWYNWLITNVFTPQGVPPAQYSNLFRFPYGLDRTRGTADDPTAILNQPYLDVIVAIKRMVIMRPLSEDHPSFNGSNPSFDFVLKQGGAYDPGTFTAWDVDNDNDGKRDSIWVDIGLPVKTAPDGRPYKPLVAFLVLDMDGRLNLNAHSSLANLAPTSTVAQPSGNTYQLLGFADPRSAAFSSTLPRGLGYGPAEIHIGPAFGAQPSEAFRIIAGALNPANQILVPGRHGRDFLPGRVNGATDPMSIVKLQGVPQWYTAVQSEYKMRTDIAGFNAMLLDHLGQAIQPYAPPTSPTPGDTIDTPYEIQLAQNDNADSSRSDEPYSLNELERLARFSDTDSASLPDRLLKLAPTSFVSSERSRRMVTTASSHVPTPNVAVPREMRLFGGAGGLGTWAFGPDDAPGRRGVDDDGNGTVDDLTELGWAGSDDTVTAPTLTQMYLVKLIQGRLAAGKPNNPTILARELRKLMPPELLHGEMFDVNRRFGNGADDNNNEVVDEPLFESPTEPAWPVGPPAPPGNFASAGVRFNFQNNDDVMFYTQREDAARTAYARHLYCLAMLLVERDDTQDFQWPYSPGEIPAPNPTQQKQLKARWVAQWAINVVDFRDSDAIMTPFEYDTNPFDGWDVDGVVSGVGPGPDGAPGVFGVDDNGNGTVDDQGELGAMGSDDFDDYQLPHRGLVWGAEYPDLLLTETVATHDRRVKDTLLDVNQKSRTSNPNPDQNLDQYAIPQGSLFLELYCTRNFAANNSAFPRELYSTTGPSGGPELDLGRLSPVRNVTVGATSVQFRYPVWRVAISEPHLNLADSVYVKYVQGGQNPDRVSFDPERMSVLNETPAVLPQVRIERLVWFSPQNPQPLVPLMQAFAPNANPEPYAEAIYYGRKGAITNAGSPTTQAETNVLVAPNRYAVLGPRPVTRMGALINGTDGDPATWEGSPYTVNLTGLNLAANEYDPMKIGTGPQTYPVNALPAVALVAAANLPTDWTGGGPIKQVGVSVSEPLPYPNPDPFNRDTYPHGHYYMEPNPNNDPRPSDSPDAYMDTTLGVIPGVNQLPDNPFDSQNNRPLSQINLTNTQTTLNHRTAFLQRLANPLLPWNPYAYLVSGLPNPLHDPTLPANPYITVDWASIDLTVFNGEDRENLHPGAPANWDPDDLTPNPALVRFGSRERGSVQRPPAAVNATDILLWPYTSRQLQTQTAEDVATKSDNMFRHWLVHSLGYLNTTLGTPGGVPGYQGAPNSSVGETPFPWLTWLNRPFANPMELMLVPGSSQARLFHDFALSAPAATNMYDATALAVPSPQSYDMRRAPYAHLMNFFMTSDMNSGANARKAPHLYRLFDYVGTRSPFIGTEKWYEPAAFANSGVSVPPGFRPPYNRLSRFRDPGRVNINTIFDRGVWEGINKLNPSFDPTTAAAQLTWDQVIASRRGYPTGGPNSMLEWNDGFPTVFVNPFRTADSADLMPNVSSTSGPGTYKMRLDNPVDATLLRRKLGNSNEPLFNFVSNDNANNTQRNAYFRYQGMERLSNLVTTHSNVFGVWVTVGYFEVERNPGGVDAVHPDGYAFGRERGEDTGTAVRHRSFFIIDRSVPVAFEPGEDHNIDRAILLRRYIE